VTGSISALLLYSTAPLLFSPSSVLLVSLLPDSISPHQTIYFFVCGQQLPSRGSPAWPQPWSSPRLPTTRVAAGGAFLPRGGDKLPVGLKNSQRTRPVMVPDVILAHLMRNPATPCPPALLHDSTPALPLYSSPALLLPPPSAPCLFRQLRLYPTRLKKQSDILGHLAAEDRPRIAA